MSHRMSLFLRRFYVQSTWSCRFCSSVSKEEKLDDPAPLFFNKEVQTLLTKLTRVDLKKIFRSRKDGIPLTVPQFKFMTNEELEEAQQKSLLNLHKRLQMPPVVKVQPDTIKVLSKDDTLEGYSQSNFMITDISYGISDKNRLIVVREPDGTLRHALNRERNRMNQLYFPRDGKQIEVPKMFHDPYFFNLLERKEYEFILNCACIQFEPDDLEYHRIVKQVYEYVHIHKEYDALRSTRHFGPFVFYLAWEEDIDNLLIDIIGSNRIDEAVLLIQLYHIIHPEAESAVNVQDEDDMGLINRYITLDSLKRMDLEAAVSSYTRLQNAKREVEEGVRIAHGLNVSTEQLETQPN